MSDQVDTDALRARAEALVGPLSVLNLDYAATDLRAAADEVDDLRSELRASVNMHEQARQLVDRLWKMIEDAPHMESCQMSYLSSYPKARCGCWKAEVL